MLESRLGPPLSRGKLLQKCVWKGHALINILTWPVEHSQGQTHIHFADSSRQVWKNQLPFLNKMRPQSFPGDCQLKCEHPVLYSQWGNAFVHHLSNHMQKLEPLLDFLHQTVHKGSNAKPPTGLGSATCHNRNGAILGMLILGFFFSPGCIADRAAQRNWPSAKDVKPTLKVV